MTAANPTTQTFSSTQSTPLIRIYGLIMGVLHIPSLVAGFVGVLFSVIAFPLLPFTAGAFITGVVLYQKYWAIYRDKLAESEVEKLWKRTLYFNALLLIPAVLISINIETNWSWLVVGFLSVSIFLSKSALHEMNRVTS